MRKVMINFWNTVGAVFNWYMKRNRFNIANGASVTACMWFVVGWAYSVHIVSAFTLSIVFFPSVLLMMFLADYDVESKIVKKISKNSCAKPREMLRQFSNISYIYGLIHWLFFVSMYIYALCTSIYKIEISIAGYIVVNAMLFTFFWFTYHIYINENLVDKYSVIKLRLQLYGTIASTISAILLVVNNYQILKIMVTMLALVYTWLNYIIQSEIQNSSISNIKKERVENIESN